MPGDLACLYKARRRLRDWRLATPDAFRAATPEQLATLGPEVVATVRGLLGRHGIRSRLLWWDAEAEGCDWSACVFSGGGFKRGLTLTFPDTAAGERRAWAMLAGLVRITRAKAVSRDCRAGHDCWHACCIVPSVWTFRR